MAEVTRPSSFDASLIRRMVYVLLLLLAIASGYWITIRFMTRDLVDNRRDLAPHMEYYVSDPFYAIRSMEERSDPEFLPVSEWPKRMPIDEAQFYWFRFPLEGAGLNDREEEYFVEMRENQRPWTLRAMQLYVEDGDELKELGPATGYQIPLEERPYTRGGFSIPIDWDEIPEGTTELFLRTSLRRGFYPHFYLWNDQGSLERFKARINGMVYFNFGILLSVLVYLGVLLGVMKLRVLAYFFLYVLTWIGLLFSYWIAQEGFWPVESRKLLAVIGLIGTSLAHFFLLLFTFYFLELKKRLARYTKIFLALTYLNFLALVALLIAFFLDYERGLLVLYVFRDLAISLFLIVVGIHAMFIGVRPALYYNASFILILGSQVINLLIGFEVLPNWPFPFSELPTTDNVLALGTLLFSFAIADNMRLVQTQRDRAQAESVQRLQQINELETQAKESLEQQVLEKTQHLVVEIERAQNAEAALGRALEGELEAGKTKSAFFANMSHELRTPLNAILGYARLLDRADYDDAKRKQAAKVIEQSGSHLLELINDILSLSKVEAGRIELQEDTYALHDMLQELVTMMEINASQKGLQLQYECDAGVPATVQGDRRHLRQILINLLGNAIKFTEQGSIRLEATKPDSNSKDVCISISDTGVGIPEENYEAIFEPFKQVGGGIQASEGTGLGLAISRRLARLMGGDLTVQSSVGKGSTFSLTIPLPAASASEVVKQGPVDLAEPSDKEVVEPSTAKLIFPPEEMLEKLRAQVSSGYVQGIRDLLQELDSPEHEGFVDRIQAYLAEFDIEGIETFINNPT